MKRKISSLSVACIKYIAPSISLIAMPTSFAASTTNGAPCYRLSCVVKRTPQNIQYSWLLTPKLVQSSSSAGNLPKVTKYKVPNNQSICINHNAKATTGHGINTTSQCHFQIVYWKNGLVTSLRKNPSAIAFNRLIHLTYSPNGIETSNQQGTRGDASANRLAKITVQLILSDLNAVPGGIHINHGEPINIKILTEKQRVVLNNHHGLILEALRQLKTAQASV